MDEIFENLPNCHAKEFPGKVTDAIRVGRNLEPVKWQFALVLLAENAERVKALVFDEKLKAQILAAIEQVAAVNREAAEGGSMNEAARSAAESAAWSAAYIRYANALIVLLKAA